MTRTDTTTPVDQYLRRSAAIVQGVLDRRLTGILVGGSLAHDDFHPHGSDVDLLVLTDGPVPTALLEQLATRLDHLCHPCPAKGLDLLGYEQMELRQPPRDITASFGLVTGPTWRTELTGRERDTAFLIDVAVARDHGCSLIGPPPNECIGDFPTEWLESTMRGTVPWHRKYVHDPFHDPLGVNAVLNACRAWRFLTDGALVSKSDAGAWAVPRLADPTVVHDAIRARRESHPHPLPDSAVHALLDAVGRALDSQSRTSGPEPGPTPISS